MKESIDIIEDAAACLEHEAAGRRSYHAWDGKGVDPDPGRYAMRHAFALRQLAHRLLTNDPPSPDVDPVVRAVLARVREALELKDGEDLVEAVRTLRENVIASTTCVIAKVEKLDPELRARLERASAESRDAVFEQDTMNFTGSTLDLGEHSWHNPKLQAGDQVFHTELEIYGTLIKPYAVGVTGPSWLVATRGERDVVWQESSIELHKRTAKSA